MWSGDMVDNYFSHIFSLDWPVCPRGQRRWTTEHRRPRHTISSADTAKKGTKNIHVWI